MSKKKGVKVGKTAGNGGGAVSNPNAKPKSTSLLGLVIATVVPFLCGLFISSVLIVSSDDSLGQHDSNVDMMAHRGMSAMDDDDDTAMMANFAKVKSDFDFVITAPAEDVEEARHGRFQRLTDAAVELNADSPDNPFGGINMVIHRNGEYEHCASSAARRGNDTSMDEDSMDEDDEDEDMNIYNALLEAAVWLDSELDDFDKYDFDSYLTTSLAHFILKRQADAQDQCQPELEPRTHKVRSTPHLPEQRTPPLLRFCDMGTSRTPILPDHDLLVPVPVVFNSKLQSLPCHFHTREGVRITSLNQLANYARDLKLTASENCADGEEQTCAASTELHLYAVPAGRVFMFAPSYVGEIFDLPHVSVHSGLPVSLKVLSLQPRVFDIANFFDKEESADIVKKALAETSDSHKIKRSSTGSSGYNINSRRTSENGFDTHGKTAMEVKRRCFDVLGFDEYIESFADGLQVLRYNLTTAYIPHLDWIDDHSKREEHNFDSAGVGSNRFSTILLYMSDLGENDGGETVFAHGWPADVPESERMTHEVALKELRDSEEGQVLKPGSWEEEMAAKCRNRLSIRPNSARAVLFYSQHPNGEPDSNSLHGGCPVLRGTKWAANLWTWNAPRNGYEGAPVNPEVVERNRKNGKSQSDNNPEQLKATFANTGRDPAFAQADLYFQETFWGPFSHGSPELGVNTYEGHVWNVMVDGKVAKTWTINKEKNQRYEV